MLELDNCLLITDVTLEHLENCHNLERIELYDCQQVTRAGIKRIRVRVVLTCLMSQAKEPSAFSMYVKYVSMVLGFSDFF